MGMEERTVSVGELGRICGLGEKQVQNLANDGVFQKAGRGAYLLEESLRGWLEYRERLSRRDVSLAADVDVVVEEAKKMRAEREIKEIQADLMKGRVMETEAVLFVAGEVLTMIRNKLLALPDRLIPEIVQPDEVVAAKDVAGRMINEVLEDLSISGYDIARETDFKRVCAPVSAADVTFSSPA